MAGFAHFYCLPHCELMASGKRKKTSSEELLVSQHFSMAFTAYFQATTPTPSMNGFKVARL